jgi:hypothetical protein
MTRRIQEHPLKIYRPDYPYNNYIELQKSKIPFGDARHFPWETTYHADMRPLSRQENQQAIDTLMLQKTHWNPGDLPGPKESEYHHAYPDWGVNCQRQQEVTRDSMMATTFSLSDGVSKMTRTVAQPTAADVEPMPKLKEQMEATHFTLADPSEPGWSTTHATAFTKPDGEPAQPPHMELMRGAGVKSTFENLGAFGPSRSLYKDTYRQQDLSGLGRIPKATIRGDHINFEQNIGHRWQKTHFDVGDDLRRWSTTSGDALTPKRVTPVDPTLARERRQAGTRSCVMQGNDEGPTQRTTMMDALQPHPDCVPPPLAERTAFISHQDHRNWNKPTTTNNRAEYVWKTAEIPDPCNIQLQDSHASFGNPAIREMETLYDATFKKPPMSMERADVEAARAFHMGHHSKTATTHLPGNDRTEYQSEYTGCVGGKASEICDGLKGGHNIVANDPRHIIRESCMKEQFRKHPDVRPPPPIDNYLQDSHLPLKGGGVPWTTTQMDYFWFETYHMPGRPF